MSDIENISDGRYRTTPLPAYAGLQTKGEGAAPIRCCRPQREVKKAGCQTLNKTSVHLIPLHASTSAPAPAAGAAGLQQTPRPDSAGALSPDASASGSVRHV